VRWAEGTLYLGSVIKVDLKARTLHLMYDAKDPVNNPEEQEEDPDIPLQVSIVIIITTECTLPRIFGPKSGSRSKATNSPPLD
jgi:hypothetical protein